MTPILREILRTQNLLQVEHCAFLEAIHLFQTFGCVRNKRQCPTALPNQKSYRWILDCEWMDYLFLWDVMIKVLRTPQQETVREITNPNPNKREPEMLINYRMWTTLPQTHTLLKVSLSCTPSKTMKQWSKWSSRAEVQQWDTYPEPTELLLIGCSIELIWTPRSKSNMSTPKTNSQTC